MTEAADAWLGSEAISQLANRPEKLTEEELRAFARVDRVRYVIKRFGPTQEKFAAKLTLAREIVNRIANGGGVGPAYADRIGRVTGYPPELFRTPASRLEAEREAAVSLLAIREAMIRLEERVESLEHDQGTALARLREQLEDEVAQTRAKVTELADALELRQEVPAQPEERPGRP